MSGQPPTLAMFNNVAQSASQSPIELSSVWAAKRYLTIVVHTKGGEGENSDTLPCGQETSRVGPEIWGAVRSKQVNRVIPCNHMMVHVSYMMIYNDAKPAALVMKLAQDVRIFSSDNIKKTFLIRLETLDHLDRLKELEEHDDLKSKLLFSVIVVR